MVTVWKARSGGRVSLRLRRGCGLCWGKGAPDDEMCLCSCRVSSDGSRSARPDLSLPTPRAARPVCPRVAVEEHD